MHLQAEQPSFMIMSVGFSSTSSPFTLSTWDHSWRLSAPVNRELPGCTGTYSHTQPLAKLWNIFVNFCFQVSEGKCIHVPVGCQARFRTTDFNTNCPVFCHWQFTFLKIKIKTIFQKVNNDEVGQDLSNRSSPWFQYQWLEVHNSGAAVSCCWHVSHMWSVNTANSHDHRKLWLPNTHRLCKIPWIFPVTCHD